MKPIGHKTKMLAASLLAASMLIPAGPIVTKGGDQSAISDAAYPLLAERVMVNRMSFYVYQDSDSGFNHGFPSGFFGAIGKIHLDASCLHDRNAANGCSTASNRLDCEPGTVLKISFDPLAPREYAGVSIEEPERWSANHRGMGYDLAFTLLAAIETNLGNTNQANEWTRAANVAGDFVMQMFDLARGRFHAGTVPIGTPPDLMGGIKPDGPQRGNDVINTFNFLDANSFTTLALAAAPRYRNQIDWRRPVQFVLDNFAQWVKAGGKEFHGFNIVEKPTAGPNGIAWEFTGQAVVLMRFVDRLYGETRFEAAANFYLDQIRQAQTMAPFGDGRGLVASTVQGGDLRPIEQCLSTPFQCIPERVGLAATTWAIFAERSINPLYQTF